MNILKKIYKGCCWFVKSLFFSGLEIILVLFRARPLDDALEEYEQVMQMDWWDGYIQMLLNNEKYY